MSLSKSFYCLNRYLSPIAKLCIILSLSVLTNACNADSQAQTEDINVKTQIQRPKQVVALGQLIPREVIKLSVANAEDSRVNKILVKEGDRVQ